MQVFPSSLFRNDWINYFLIFQLLFIYFGKLNKFYKQIADLKKNEKLIKEPKIAEFSENV